MKKSYDVVIIGGGPAGSAAAIYLKDEGFNVGVVEKKAFPRETLCGEFLSVEVITALKNLNLFEKFKDLYPNEINSFRFINHNGRYVSADFNFNAFGIKRSTFDAFLLTTAKERGAEVIQPAEVMSIDKKNNFYELRIKDENEYIIVKSYYVIAAYGKQNSLDKTLRRSFAGYTNSRLNGIKFHAGYSLLKNFPKNEICIYSADGIYCGVNAVNDNTVTLCFLEDRNIADLPPRKQLIGLIQANQEFKKLFYPGIENELSELPVYGTGNIYFGKREKNINGIFFIGDAAGVIAPLAGDGIGMAFESAKLCSEILTAVRNGNLNMQDSSYIYDKEWNNRFSGRLKVAKTIQNFVLNKYLRTAGFYSALIFPPLLKYLVKETRSGSK